MAKKNTKTPTALESALDAVYGNSEYKEEVSDLSNEDFLDDVAVEKENNEDTPANIDEAEENKNLEKETDDSDIPEEVLENIKKAQSKNDPGNSTENSDEEVMSDEALLEAQQVGALFDAVGESLGWNMADIKEDERPLTVDDLTQYLTDVVNQNSVPVYADDRVRQLDEYVKNGGKFEDFYQRQQQALSFDNLDMEDEANQKAVVRELLQRSGYTDEQITSKINRYADADMLIEESEDALARLKEIRQAEIELATKMQEEEARAQEENAKKFFNSVANDINNLTDIRGILIPKEDRKALMDYIFKVDASGLSLYQKDFNANLEKNLIESAYFTMKADALISSAKKDGETSAAEKLRKMLRHSAKNHSTYNVEEKTKSIFDIASI